MTRAQLGGIYRDYIACLNEQDWQRLGQFVHDDVTHNGRKLGLSGYRKMLERNFSDVPDLHFDIQLLVCDPPHVASRLGFDCRPKASFLGLDVDGKRVRFTENVFYEFSAQKIRHVLSIIDRTAIEAQL